MEGQGQGWGVATNKCITPIILDFIEIVLEVNGLFIMCTGNLISVFVFGRLVEVGRRFCTGSATFVARMMIVFRFYFFAWTMLLIVARVDSCHFFHFILQKNCWYQIFFNKVDVFLLLQ